MATTNLVYIMGRRYCGSTILSALLDNAPSITNIGEVIEGKQENPINYCSCGKPREECPHLRNIRSVFESRTEWNWNEAIGLIRDQSRPHKFLPTLLKSSDNSTVETLRQINGGIITAASETANASLVVDSSKECARGFFFARFMPQDKIIHLVRNPTRLAGSVLHRLREGNGISFFGRTFEDPRFYLPYLLQSGINWTIENTLGEVVHRTAPDRVLRVHYEDLCRSPRVVLGRIEHFLECNLKNVIRAVEQKKELRFGHSFGGNHVRMDQTFVFNPAKTRKRQVPPHYRALTDAVCWPLMIPYGYGW